MSKQLDAAKNVWERNKALIMTDMVAQAEEFVGKNLNTEEAYTFLFDDGSFDPFINAPIGGTEYMDLIGELGNELDECDFICQTWIDVLSASNALRYAEIINKFEDIKEIGL